MNNQEVEDRYNEIKEKIAEEYGIEASLKDAEYKVKAIGYLSIAESPYNVGEVPDGFVDKLKQVFYGSVMFASCGFHECEFCLNQGVKKLSRDALSSSEKSIRDEKNKVEYMFPKMIFHYIEVHQFKPPEEFIKFIMSLMVC